MTNHIISLDHLGLIQITGAGAQSLLQGQLTCNLNEFAPDTAYLGAHCNPQGRIISLFRIVAVTNGYLLQMPLNLLPSAFAALKKYAGFYQVELAIVTEQFDQFGFYGQPIANPASHLPACYFLHGELDRSLIFVAKSETLNWQATLPNTAIWGPATDWQALEITRGIPAVYLETSTKFLPHELNLPKLNAISFNKGCFTGQEIIARMQYRGKLKSQLYLA
jgi:folate-binding protein YgfZ